MRRLWTLIALVVIFTLNLVVNAIAQDKVVLGELSWDGSRAIAHVLKEIIESRFEYEAEIVQAESDTIFAGMDKGNGSFDVYTDLWMPNHADKWAHYIENRASIDVNDNPYTGEQGLFIPGYIQDKYGIKSIEDLADPRIAKLFDSDGDGKGEYWPGAPDWNSTNVELVKAKSYGYDEYFKPYIVTDSTFQLKLKRDYKHKKAILFYYWTPEWIHSTYDLRRLREPPYDTKDDSCWNMIQPIKDKDWLEKSNVKCAWPEAKVYLAFSKSLTTRTPKLAKFLRQVAFNASMINEWILKIRQEKYDLTEVAKEWVKNNPDIVNKWLAGIIK